MRKQTGHKPVLFAHALRMAILGLFAFVAVLTTGLASFSQSANATATPSSYINFQARLESAAGAIAPDGNYDVTFHVFNSVTAVGGTSTDTGCGTDTSCLWEETYTYNSGPGSTDVRLRVVNGYLTANLGSITSFGAINWSQRLWLTMDIGGTAGSGTITWDGQMSPRMQLTAVPYAFQAGALGQTDGSGNLGTLSFPSVTNNPAITLPNASGTVCINTNNCNYAPSTGGTGYVQLQNTTPGTQQPNGNFNISGTGILGGLTIQNASSQNLLTVDTGTNHLKVYDGTATQSYVDIYYDDGTTSAVIAASTGTTKIGSGTGPINITAGASAAVTITAHSGSSFTTDAGNLTLDVTSASAPTLNVGTGSQAKSIVVGNTTGATSILLQAGSGGVQIASLSSATTTSAAVCRDTSTNKLTACDSSNTSGAAFLQGGNNFGGNATLGTTGASQTLAVETAGTSRLVIDTSATTNFTLQQASNILVASAASGQQLTIQGGAASSGTNTGGTLLLQGGAGATTGASGSVIVRSNTNNSTTAFQVQNASNAAVLSVDTTASRVSVGAIGTAAGQLYVSGTLPTGTVGSVTTDAGPETVYVQGNYLYETSFTTNTFQVFDITNPTSPVSMSSTSTGASSGPVGIYVQGRYAYITNSSSNTLKIFDISNPTSPSAVSTTTIGNTSYSVYVQGRYAYVANRADSTFQIFDVSNPASPVLMSTTSSSALLPVWVTVQGKYLYLANHGSGTNKFAIFDISNPASPVLVGGRNTTSGIDSIYVQGRYAYIASILNNALQIMDISNPALPTIAATVTTNMNQPNTVYVQGRYAYVTNAGNNTVAIVDISNPTAPANVGTVSSGGTDVSDVFVQGRYAYVSNFTSGTLKVFDVGGSYIQQLEAGGILTGTLQTYDNVSVGGSIDIRGGLQATGSAQIIGNLGVSGTSYLQGSLGIAGGIQGGVTVNGLSTPSVPTVTPTGGTGSTSYSYAVAAVSASGGTTPASSNGSTATGVIFTSLSSSVYNAITWTPVSGAVSYKVYRTVGGTTQGLIGTTSVTTLNDTGLAASGSAPTLDTSGALTVNGYATFKNAVNTTTAFQVQNSSSANLLTVDTSNNALVVGPDGTTTAMTIRGGAATGTNVAGSDLTVDASNGTGLGGSGSLIFRTALGVGTPAQDSVSAAQHQTATTSLSWSHTIGNQSNRLLVVGVNVSGTTGAATVKFNGASLTALPSGSVNDGTAALRTEIWYLKNPAIGTGTVAVTFAGSTDVVAGSASYYNVNQTTPFGTPATLGSTGTGSTPASVTVGSTTTANIVFSSFAFKAVTGFWTPTSTQLWYDGTSNGGAASSATGSAGSTIVQWNNSSTGEKWALVGVAINAAGGTPSGSDALTDRLHIAANGNIGISNTNPQATLDVAGNLNVKISATNALEVQDASAVPIFTVDTSNQEVGFGTTDSSTRVHVGLNVADAVNGSAVLIDGNFTSSTQNTEGLRVVPSTNLSSNSSNFYDGIIAGPYSDDGTHLTNAGAGLVGLQATPFFDAASGTLGQLIGVDLQPTNNDTATVTVAKGLNVQTVNNGTIGTNYGLYIDAPANSGTITNNYALVTNAGAGNVGIGTIAPTFQLDVAGTARVQVTSPTAFQVQDAGSSTVLTIDTSGHNVIIGAGSAGEATASLLVLDSKTAATEPTEVDGAIYYNNALEQFRCGRDGAWENCGINPIDRGFNIEDEFIGGNTTNGSIGALGWTDTTITTDCATKSYNSIAAVANRPGSYHTATAATLNTGCTVSLNTADMILAAGQTMKAAFSVSAATNEQARVGWYAGVAKADPTTSGLWWEAISGTANWRYCYATGAAVNCANSTVAVAANTFVRLEIRLTATGAGTSAATFIINGNSFNVSGVTIGTGTAVQPAFTCTDTSVATAIGCDIDYYQLRGVASAAR